MSHRAYSLAQVLTLHAKFLTATGQDVLAGGPGTLGPGGSVCGSGHVSALAGSLCGKNKRRVLRFSGDQRGVSNNRMDSSEGLT